MDLNMMRCLASAAAFAAAGAAFAHPIDTAISARIDASSQPMPGEPSLAEIRAATEPFRHLDAALAAGYILPADMCDTAEMMGKPAAMGAMGIHYIRPDLLGISAPPNPRVDGTGTYTDFSMPAVLIYEPKADGSRELVAVENLVFAKAWAEAGHSEPPTFHGQSWDYMVDDPATELDEAHGFEPHYDRHVWLYRENPNGVFAQYNPAVSCDTESHATAAHSH